jgi:hypothetical protein
LTNAFEGIVLRTGEGKNHQQYGEVIFRQLTIAAEVEDEAVKLAMGIQLLLRRATR